MDEINQFNYEEEMAKRKLHEQMIKKLSKKVHKKQLAVFVGLMVTVFSFFIYSMWYVRKTSETTSEAGPQAKLTLDPSSGDLNIGEVYPLFVILDTNGANVNAIDLNILFDKDVFEIIDQDQSRPGTQISNQLDAFSYNPVNAVDNQTGTIKFTAIAFDNNKKVPTSTFNGKKPVALIKFRPKKSTTSKFSIRFSENSTNDSNVAESTGNQDILSEVKDATYKISAPVVIVNAKGISDKGLAPKLRLSVKDGAVEKVYSEVTINNKEYEDKIFSMSQNLTNGNIIYFDFYNDTRESEDSKQGAANRDIYIKYIKIGDRTFYLDPQKESEKQQTILDRDQGRIYYDRADKDDGTLYDGGSYGSFGNARDAKKDSSGNTVKLLAGYLDYDRPLGFGPNFTGQMLWNGSIVIKVDWISPTLKETPTINTSPIPTSITNFEPTSIPSVSTSIIPTPKPSNLPVVVSTPVPSAFNPTITNSSLNQNASLPKEPVLPCTEPTGQEYQSAFLSNSLNTIDPIKNPDFNLSVRGYQLISNDSKLKILIDDNKTNDLLSPNLSDLFNTNKIVLSSVYKLTNVNSPAVSMIGIKSSKNQIVNAPSSGYILSSSSLLKDSSNYKSVVLFADVGSLTLNYTLDDSVTTGYTVYLENICVDKNLLAAYKESSPSGTIKRTKLPLIKSNQPVGRVNGNELLVAISEKGKFADPRLVSNWWR